MKTIYTINDQSDCSILLPPVHVYDRYYLLKLNCRFPGVDRYMSYKFRDTFEELLSFHNKSLDHQLLKHKKSKINVFFFLYKSREKKQFFVMLKLQVFLRVQTGQNPIWHVQLSQYLPEHPGRQMHHPFVFVHVPPFLHGLVSQGS